MTKIANVPYVIPSINYSLDYTKTTQGTAQTVLDITTPSYPIRIQVLALSFASAAVNNWVFKLDINTAPFSYPDGINAFQIAPTGGVYTLVGNVPTDYIDIPANSRIRLYAYMNGSAGSNSNMLFYLLGKQIIEP